MNTQGMEIILNKEPDQDELTELKQQESFVVEADSLCEEVVRLWPKKFRHFLHKGWNSAAPMHTEKLLLEVALPQEQDSARGRGL